MLDLGLYLLYALLIIALAAAIIFPIFHLLKDPKALVRTGIGIGIVLVVFGLSYAMADSAVSLKAAALGTTESSSRLIGAGLNMFFITLGLAAVSLLYSEISKAFK